MNSLGSISRARL